MSNPIVSVQCTKCTMSLFDERYFAITNLTPCSDKHCDGRMEFQFQERIIEVAGHRGFVGIRQTKEEVAKRQNAKITCECGAVTSKNNLPVHKRSKKHLTLMETGIWIRNATRRGEIYKPRTKKNKPRVAPRAAVKTINGVAVKTKEAARLDIVARQKSTRTCVGCGTKVLYNSMWNHLRSPKHRQLMAAGPQPKHFIKKRKYKLIILDY